MIGKPASKPAKRKRTPRKTEGARLSLRLEPISDPTSDITSFVSSLFCYRPAQPKPAPQGLTASWLDEMLATPEATMPEPPPRRGGPRCPYWSCRFERHEL